MTIKLPAFFILLILILSPFRYTKVCAQNFNIDSVEVLLKKAEGIDKIPYYYALTNYYSNNATDRAILLTNEFLILAEKIDSTEIVEYCYNILGESYFFQENYEKSLEYFIRFLDINIEEKDDIKIGHAYNNLGIVYRATEDYDRSIECYKKALEINQKYNNVLGLSSTYNNLGVLHENLNLFAQARDYYAKSLHIENKLNNLDGISISYLNLGGINYKLKNYSKAIEFCSKSIKICDSLAFQITLEMNYEVLYKIYKETNNSVKALQYFEKFHELKGNRINQESNAHNAELEVKYDSNKKQLEIESLNKQQKRKTIINKIILFGLAIFVALVIALSQISKFRHKKNQLLILQNAEIMLQKEEIESQRDEIEAQTDEIKRQIDISEFQNKQILKQNKDITDSIEYAQHIQAALFPDKVTLHKALKNGFCFFKPKDIVSGDFYWVAQIANKSVIVAADCTGHGVPGAFMSIIGINFLNEIVYDDQILKPSEILAELRKKIIKTMVHANRINESKDGMDMAIVVIDYDHMSLDYAGAYNPLFMIRDHMLHVIRADKMPVGISEKAINPFTNHHMEIKPDDLFYMFTDGFADQFGGPLRKKFRVGNLRDLLLEIHDKEIAEQKQILHETFLTWKDKQPQVDDVLAIGIKI